MVELDSFRFIQKLPAFSLALLINKGWGSRMMNFRLTNSNATWELIALTPTNSNSLYRTHFTFSINVRDLFARLVCQPQRNPRDYLLRYFSKKNYYALDNPGNSFFLSQSIKKSLLLIMRFHWTILMLFHRGSFRKHLLLHWTNINWSLIKT